MSIVDKIFWFFVYNNSDVEKTVPRTVDNDNTEEDGAKWFNDLANRQENY